MDTRLTHPESTQPLDTETDVLMEWTRESIRLSGASTADIAAAIGVSAISVDQLLRDGDPSILTRARLYTLGGMSMRPVPPRVLRALRQRRRTARTSQSRPHHVDRRRLTALQFRPRSVFDVKAKDARSELGCAVDIVVDSWASADHARNRAILRDRFGIEDGSFASLQAAAKPYGLTRERVRQIERRFLRHAASVPQGWWHLPHLLALARSANADKVLPRSADTETRGPFTTMALAFARALWPDLVTSTPQAVRVPPFIDLHGRIIVDRGTIAQYKTAARWAVAMQAYTGAVFLPDLAAVTGLPPDVLRAAAQSLRGVRWFTDTWFSLPRRRIGRLATAARHIIAIAGQPVTFDAIYAGAERANRRGRSRNRITTTCQPVPPREITRAVLRSDPLFAYDPCHDVFTNVRAHDAMADLTGAHRAIIQATLERGGAMGLDDFERIHLGSGASVGRVNLRMLLSYAPELERKAPGVYAIRGRTLPDGLLESIAVRRPFGITPAERAEGGPFAVSIRNVAKTLHHSQTYLHAGSVPRSAPGRYVLAGTTTRACTIVEDSHGTRIQNFSADFRRALGNHGSARLDFDDAARTVAVRAGESPASS